MRLLESANAVFFARGRKREKVDLTEEGVHLRTVAEQMLGPTGNLRAPTMKMADLLLVGFNEENYKEVLTD